MTITKIWAYQYHALHLNCKFTMYDFIQHGQWRVRQLFYSVELAGISYKSPRVAGTEYKHSISKAKALLSMVMDD